MADTQSSTRDKSDAADKDRGYLVLARKYRPRTFEDLIGQEPMVKTLKHAFEANRIPQAWMLTGVRGVGKTTTARILARALNYEIGDEGSQPTIEMPEIGAHCQAIMDSRHVDVIEMDAASHTGIDDIRDITDAARYKPASARYKVYIIDEVHMLSKAAFNGLLKTLEEPPEHVKFIFATTEIRKVPVTVLSRCQRFDLRRIERPVLVQFLAGICDAEEVEAETEALVAIAKAGEGSVRDALSLLDQAIAHGAGSVRIDSVVSMLGLVDQGRTIDLFEHVMAGRAKEMLELFDTLYHDGADPLTVITDLTALSHDLTETKILPDRESVGMTADMVKRRGEVAKGLTMADLSQAWQILFNGVKDVQIAVDPKQAADMVLVRLTYASKLPSPEKLIERLQSDTEPSISTSPALVARSPSKPVAQLVAAPSRPLSMVEPKAPDPNASVPTALEPEKPPLLSFEDVVALARSKREALLVTALERHVSLVSFEQGRIEIALLENASPTVANDLSERLKEWTGTRWMVVVASSGHGETLHTQKLARTQKLIEEAEKAPEVQRVLEAFPGSRVVHVDLQDSHGGLLEDEGQRNDPAEPHPKSQV